MFDVTRFQRVHAALTQGEPLDRSVVCVLTLVEAYELWDTLRRMMGPLPPPALGRPPVLPEPEPGRVWGVAYGMLIYVLDAQDVADAERFGVKLGQRKATAP